MIEFDLAVVIVNYNAGDYLERCLRSLAEHRGDIRLDVLVIDNASGDGSHRPAVAAHPWARIIENLENVFLSPAWNQGIRETSAPYVLFLNPDVEWWQGTLADYVRIASRHPRAGIVGPLVRNSEQNSLPERPYLSGAGRRRRACVPRHAGPANRSHAGTTWTAGTEPPSVRWIGCRAAACSCRVRDSRDVGPFDEFFPLYGEELEMGTRLRDRGWSVLFTPEVGWFLDDRSSTGRSREQLVMHSMGIYRYYASTVPTAGVGQPCRSRGECFAFGPRSSGCGALPGAEPGASGRRTRRPPRRSLQPRGRSLRSPLIRWEGTKDQASKKSPSTTLVASTRSFASPPVHAA